MGGAWQLLTLLMTVEALLLLTPCSFLCTASQARAMAASTASNRPAAGTRRAAFDASTAATTSKSSSARRRSSADISQSWSASSSSSANCRTAYAMHPHKVRLH